MNMNPQPIADALVLDEDKILSGSREEITRAIYLACCLMDSLWPLAANLSRGADACKADKVRLGALNRLNLRLSENLLKREEEAIEAAKDEELWKALRGRAMGAGEQTNGVEKKPKR